MKINNASCLVSAINEKINTNTNKVYWKVSIVSLDGSGTALDINVKDKDTITKLDLMTKYRLNLILSSSQYGLKVELDELNPISENLGSILGE